MSYFGIPLRNGLPIGLGSVAALGTNTFAPFNPASLFANGEQGWIYNPSNFATLFQDSAGTTPVTAVEQPVGLQLDLSGRNNHRFQATSGNRPVVSARVNLLTKTEDFSNAVWQKNDATVTASGSAWRITDATVLASGNVLQSVTVAANIPHTFQIEFDKQASGFFALSVGNFFCYVNHATLATFNETLFAGVNASSSVALVSGTRYRVTCTVTLTGGSSFVRIYAAVGAMSGDINSATNITATGFLDVYQADFRVTNQGVGLPVYQRVNTSTDYTSTGFPIYIKPNGSNQFMQTNSINFTATDKMTVWQGVRKLSDAATAIAIELSVNAPANNGSFFIAAPVSASANYQFTNKGTIVQSASYTNALVAAPITNVLTLIGDISGDVATLRVNAAQVATSSADQGTGNYGNYPAYFYSRAGSSFLFSGNDYASIARGAASTATQITDGETWVNNLTKAYVPLVATFDFITTDASDQIITDAGDSVITDIYYG